eukprot:COSAG02_NODE_33111_length_505_cov_0.889163_1_plen_160_part_01
MVPNEARTACECPKGYSHAARPSCHMNDFEAISRSSLISQCWDCSEVSCLSSCDGGTLQVKPGWNPVVHGSRSDTKVAIFACKEDDACPAAKIIDNTPRYNCTKGYEGYLCGACSDEYSLKSNKMCEPCGSTSTVGFMIAGAMIIALALLATKLRVVYNN